MASSGLEIRMIRGAAVVKLGARCLAEYEDIESIKQRLYELIDGYAATKIALDFTEVTFLPTEAIGVLLKLKAKAEGVGGRAVIFGLADYPLEAFEFLRLHEVFEICESETQALSALGVRT